MTQDVQDAIRILKDCYFAMLNDFTGPNKAHYRARWIVNNAIHHLAYPDRDVYPKSRCGTKGAPIVRK